MLQFNKMIRKHVKQLHFVFVSDGKILVHNRGSDMTFELLGHDQEVNCLDSKDGLIISGSRDRTARVRTAFNVFINNS